MTLDDLIRELEALRGQDNGVDVYLSTCCDWNALESVKVDRSADGAVVRIHLDGPS